MYTPAWHAYTYTILMHLCLHFIHTDMCVCVCVCVCTPTIWGRCMCKCPWRTCRSCGLACLLVKHASNDPICWTSSVDIGMDTHSALKRIFSLFCCCYICRRLSLYVYVCVRAFGEPGPGSMSCAQNKLWPVFQTCSTGQSDCFACWECLCTQANLSSLTLGPHQQSQSPKVSRSGTFGKHLMILFGSYVRTNFVVGFLC